MTAPSICFAMARDGLMFQKLGAIHPRYQTMSFGIVAQALWTAVLVLTGSFETLIAYAMIAAWFFYGLTVTGVTILRRRYPNRARPYRMWGYPVTPWLFTAVAGWFVVNTWITQPRPSTVAFLIIASGIPVYYGWRRASRRPA
jgi:basic amino acid/polyamine antiporter, APA family